jgi:hypothetical protein
VAGKHPDDLPLTDDPISVQRDRAIRDARRGDDADDPRRTEWYAFSTEILEMICSDEYRWAEDTLEGIKTTVEQRRAVTPGQRKAVENIRAARERSDGWRRRYEGR